MQNIEGRFFGVLQTLRAMTCPNLFAACDKRDYTVRAHRDVKKSLI